MSVKCPAIGHYLLIKYPSKHKIGHTPRSVIVIARRPGQVHTPWHELAAEEDDKEDEEEEEEEEGRRKN